MTAKILAFGPITTRETASDKGGDAQIANSDAGPETCDLCVHYLFGPSGEYCQLYDERLITVRQADGCPDFETP